HEIQSRQDLDTGKCRGNWWCILVYLRNGRPRWISIRRSHRPGLESFPRYEEFRNRQTMAAAVFRSDSLLSGFRRTIAPPPGGLSGGQVHPRNRGGEIPAPRLPRFSERDCL